MSEPNPELLKRAVDDCERRPWHYYRLEYDTLKKMLDEQAEKLERLAADAAPRPGQSAGEPSPRKRIEALQQEASQLRQALAEDYAIAAVDGMIQAYTNVLILLADRPVDCGV